MRAKDTSRSATVDLRSIRWRAGDRRIQMALAERPAAAFEPGATIQTNRRRTLHAVVLGVEDAGDDNREGSRDRRRVLLKTHHLATGRHRLREAIKRSLRRSPARREWRALVALQAAGVPAPRPLAYGRLASGDELIALELVEGVALRERFANADAATRDRLVANLSATLARLHASGHVHGDLHLGNLWARSGTDEIVLLDLQRLRRSADKAARLRDLASLELSLLRAEWPAAAREAVREKLAALVPHALEARGDFIAALQNFAADHVRGRMRRRRRPGRGLERVRVERRCGLRDESISESELLRLLERARESPTRRTRRGGESWIAEAELGAKAVVVKWRAEGGLGRRFLARLRGTSAARAFGRGLREQRLLARSARPLAWLEQRLAGLPGESWLVLERVGEFDLDAYRPADPAEARGLARELADWLADLHSLGQSHADLKGSNLRIRPAASDAEPPRFWLVDLEDLRGPEALGDEARLTALSQLNASIPDAHFGPDARREMLARYLARLPFEDAKLQLEPASAEIARRSLARRHRWRGESCAAGHSVVTVSQRK